VGSEGGEWTSRGHGPVGRFCSHDNETHGVIRGLNFLEQQNVQYNLKIA